MRVSERASERVWESKKKSAIGRARQGESKRESEREPDIESLREREREPESKRVSDRGAERVSSREPERQNQTEERAHLELLVASVPVARLAHLAPHHRLSLYFQSSPPPSRESERVRERESQLERVMERDPRREIERESQ